jgi:hypothetical protein
MAPLVAGSDREAEPEEEDRGERVAQRDEQPFDARPDPRAGHDHAREKCSDGVRSARGLGKAGDEDSEADDEDDAELRVPCRDDGTDQTRAPPGQGEQADQECERDRDRQGDLADPLLLNEDGLEEREVEREEDILDDDDAEDHSGLGIGDPPKVEDELRDDCCGRRPDHPRDDEDLPRTPAERPAEHEAGAEVEGDVRATCPEQTPSPGEELVDGELDPEVEEQQDQAEHREQVDLLRVLEHDDSRRLRAEDDSRDDEEGDRGKTEPPADAGEQSGEQESRPENGELAVHSRTRPRVRTSSPARSRGDRPTVRRQLTKTAFLTASAIPEFVIHGRRRAGVPGGFRRRTRRRVRGAIQGSRRGMPRTRGRGA